MNPRSYRRRAALRAYLLWIKTIVTILFLYQLFLLIFCFTQFGFVMFIILGCLLGLLWWFCV